MRRFAHHRLAFQRTERESERERSGGMVADIASELGAALMLLLREDKSGSRAHVRSDRPGVALGDAAGQLDAGVGGDPPAQLSRALIGNPFQGDRFTNFVAIDVRGLPVVMGRPNVYVLPNTQPLNITGRLYGAGGN